MLNNEVIKFILVGILNTIFYYLLYTFFIYIDFSYILAVVFATCIGVVFSFKTFSKLVFNNKDNKLIVKFIIVYGFNIVLNIFIIKSYLYLFNENLYTAGLFATVIVALNSFILNKFYVFKGSQ